MTTPPDTIRDLDHLEALIAGSFDRPLLLFKHSRSCGTSHVAREELLAHTAGAALDATYALLTVQDQRDLSDAIGRHFSLRHETPQVLVIRDGKLTWSGSHFRITASAIAAAIEAATTAAPAAV